ncbi:MAG: response regulator [Deltaproteobacteria bacterium]|nr:response regulator [Deltaproteobacteria bacterium]
MMDDRPKKTSFMLRRNEWLLLGLTGLFVLVWRMPMLPILRGSDIMSLPMHIFAETFAIVISMMVCGVAYASTENRPAPVILLGCAFLSIGLLDFAHLLSFEGMPDFISPADPGKGINFWLAARLIFALAMLAFALLPWKPFAKSRTRYWFLAGSLILTALIYRLGLYHQRIWPRTFIEGQGLTPFKIGAEYSIVVIMLAAAVLFYQKSRNSVTPYKASSLFAAVVMTILSELTFTLYSEITDIFNLVGHCYKIIAYIFIYHAIFVASVQEPFQKLHRAKSALERSEEALRESNERFRMIMDSLDALVYVADMKSYELLFLNKYGKKHWGDVVGKKCWQALQSGQSGPCPFCTNSRLLNGEGNPSGVYVWEFQNTVTKQWYDCRDQAIRWPDGRLARMEIATDISLRKQAEQDVIKAKAEWEKTFDAIGELVTIQDLRMGIMQVNQAACRALNTTKENIIGKFCYEVFRGIPTPCDDCPEIKVIQDLKTHAAEIYHENLGRTFSISVSPILDNEGRVKGTVHIAKDITAQKQSEMRLQQSQKMEAIGTLAGGIAHDFNNILTAIIGYTELVKVQVLGDKSLQDDLNQVVKAAGRASDLVQQILTFSRQQQQEKQPLRISLIIKEALKLLRAAIPSTIDIRQEIISQAVVMADATQIHQLIMNLCTNAYHAMLENGGVLEVSLKEIINDHEIFANGTGVPPGCYVLLSVSDTGSGMDRETLTKIFDPYFTTKESGKGTGLGLAVVHGIVKSHNGMITVRSEPGRGSTFTVYLPVIEREAATEVPVAIPPRAGANERVMVVDDEMAIRNLLSQILLRAGYRVDAFAGGIEAWQALSRTPDAWDILVTDQTMPGMTGDQLVAKVKTIRPDLPVILCSGYSTGRSSEPAGKTGVFAYLQKPIGRNLLLTQIAKALEKRHEK